MVMQTDLSEKSSQMLVAFALVFRMFSTFCVVDDAVMLRCEPFRLRQEGYWLGVLLGW